MKIRRWKIQEKPIPLDPNAFLTRENTKDSIDFISVWNSKYFEKETRLQSKSSSSKEEDNESPKLDGIKKKDAKGKKNKGYFEENLTLQETDESPSQKKKPWISKRRNKFNKNSGFEDEYEVTFENPSPEIRQRRRVDEGIRRWRASRLRDLVPLSSEKVKISELN